VSVHPVNLAEHMRAGETPEALVQRLADSKAARALVGADGADLVIGADTIVVQDEQILGKPATPYEATAMLMALGGRTHQVLTGLCVIDRATGRRAACVTESVVRMRDYSPSEIEAYVATGSPMDKAGAYGIQDEGTNPVDLSDFSSCFTNVMGLPLCQLDQAMDRLGYHPPVDLGEVCQSFGYHAVAPWQGSIQGAA
jgi:MAF protein